MARQAAAAEIVYYNSLWTDDVPQCIAGESYFLADYSKAEHWLRLAADAGSPQACGTLADLLCFSPVRARERSYYAARALEYGFPEELRGGPPPSR